MNNKLLANAFIKAGIIVLIIELIVSFLIIYYALGHYIPFIQIVSPIIPLLPPFSYLLGGYIIGKQNVKNGVLFAMLFGFLAFVAATLMSLGLAVIFSPHQIFPIFLSVSTSITGILPGIVISVVASAFGGYIGTLARKK